MLYSESYYSGTRREVNRKDLLLRIDGSVRIDNHQHQQGNRKNDDQDDRDAIEVLLHQRSGLLGTVQRRRNGIAYAGSLAGMQHDEHNHADARNNQQHGEQNNQRGQNISLSATTKALRKLMSIVALSASLQGFGDKSYERLSHFQEYPRVERVTGINVPAVEHLSRLPVPCRYLRARETVPTPIPKTRAI